ncbi:MAG: helix-turn-helix transcriptional regulator [Alphaproteobacteria bacterium]|nr:helix-turn-helix transcriptional regulator [Alphaproteobacteria bacterium]
MPAVPDNRRATVTGKPRQRRSPCPVAATLDVLGDKWSLVVVRDLFLGRRRFLDFLESPEKIERNILAERLRRLEKAGLISRTRYQKKPDRYEYRLTRAGAELLPVLQAMMRWGRDHLPKTRAVPDEWLAARPRQFYPAEGERFRSDSKRRKSQP